MYLVNHISESIRLMGSSDNFPTDNSKRLLITNVIEAYRATNNVNYIRQILKHNYRCTALDYMEEPLSHLVLQGWYNNDSAKVFNLLSATDKLRSTRRAHHLPLQTIADEPIIRPVS
jgi:hypothetical protein